MTLNVGTVLNNRYRVAKLVGQGGFGAVYRAWDLSLLQPVALKENSGGGMEAQRQFEREAQLLAGLRHANLPRVIDHFVLPGQGQYLVMDFVEGQSLSDLLAERGRPLDEAEVLPWIRQVADALDYLHTSTPPVIHRDIKPDNIIITDKGRAMLVDFGISKLYDPSKGTTIGAKAVTPGFSPPEQYGRGKTDPRSDVYALGATLYTLLTGLVPPDGPDLASGADTLTPPQQANPAVSAATSAAIVAAMTPNISQRLGSAEGFGQLLAAGVAQAPLRAPVVSRTAAMPTSMRTPATGGPKRAGVSVWGWLLGVAVLVALAAWLGASFLGRGGDTIEATPPTSAEPSAIAAATAQPESSLTSEPSPIATPEPDPSPTANTPPTEPPATPVPPTAEPVWPISDTGVEACHLIVNDVVITGENARLWSEPSVGSGVSVAFLSPGQNATIISGPVWGSIRRDMDFSGWWWEVNTGSLRGWIWQDRLEDCVR